MYLDQPLTIYIFSQVIYIFNLSGMQSSLLGLALANKFFVDPLVGLPAAISVSSDFVLYIQVCVCKCLCVCMYDLFLLSSLQTVVMSLMGFGLVLYWTMERKMSSKS